MTKALPRYVHTPDFIFDQLYGVVFDKSGEISIEVRNGIIGAFDGLHGAYAAPPHPRFMDLRNVVLPFAGREATPENLRAVFAAVRLTLAQEDE